MDTKVVLKYKPMMGGLLDVVTDALKADEHQGQNALGSLIELTLMHATIWVDCGQKLIYIVS